MSQANVTVDEVLMLLGAKDIELYLLRKQLQDALKQLAEAQKKGEPKRSP